MANFSVFILWFFVQRDNIIYYLVKFLPLVTTAKDFTNKRKKDCLRKQRTHYRFENGSLGFIETFHKQ